jgi:hypothetical protein
MGSRAPASLDGRGYGKPGLKDGGGTTEGYPSSGTGLGSLTGCGTGPGRKCLRRGEGVVDVVVVSDDDSGLCGRGMMIGR